ncbi:MAG: UDP-N-acetylmuramoyl-L-alanine--D-glutamate ligase [Uliginosibacterium sp.]|nr:UDP-N-acetylmuramoyl-L-alanine--D-glutamate ligase [Uliginosibacterium sp.]
MLYPEQSFLVLGLGESGLAMASWLTRQGARVRIADTREAPPGIAQLQTECPQAQIVCGAFTDELLAGVSVLALSPGISIDLPIVQRARAVGLRVTGEIELFVDALTLLGLRQRCHVLAITGTNGKTTTTALTAALLNEAGLDAVAAGNISPAALSALMSRLDTGVLPQAWVLELSSFQLETTTALNADAAAMLNVTDDHLDRHGDLGAYARAKAMIFNGAKSVVVNRDDPWVMEMARCGKPAERLVSFGLNLPEAGHYGIRNLAGDTWLVCGSKALMARGDLRLAGDHNVANALAAVALCESIGVPSDRLLVGLKSFKGLPHRVEWVASSGDGVDYFDDSKGTNVGATLAALQGLGRKVVLIAGGDGKGQDFSPLRDAFREHARAVVLIGRDARRIQQETANAETAFVQAPDMDEAVRLASERALPGDAVLLSPACASLDMFRNYAHRAEVFISAVKALPGIRS